MTGRSNRMARWGYGARAAWQRLAAASLGSRARVEPLLAGTSGSAMARQRRRLGLAGEQVACAYLKRQGYAIEAANVRFPVGEIDLIARDAGTLCMVEVRSKASRRFGSPLESITFRKQQHLLKAARWYLHRRRPRWDGPVRFDVVTVEWSDSRQPTINLLRGAFTA